MRRCPNCACELVEVSYATEQVDRCGACRGVFFDAGELEAVMSMMRLYASARLDEAEIPTVPEGELEREVTCPHDGAVMTPRQIGPLTINVCGDCGGIWLDGGELAALRLAEKHIRDNLNLYIRLGQ